jgi:hypothetical protein
VVVGTDEDFISWLSATLLNLIIQKSFTIGKFFPLRSVDGGGGDGRRFDSMDMAEH